jgi:hypothetical protein
LQDGTLHRSYQLSAEFYRSMWKMHVAHVKDRKPA